MKRPLNIIIAGGGTGGHLFPGIAVADAFMEKDARNRVVFASTGNSFELEALASAGYVHYRITAEGIKGMGLWRKLRAGFRILPGMLGAAGIIRSFRPDMVIGVGGYSSGPMVMTARIMGVPTALQEQNILPGITNRILARFVDRIYISFKESAPRFAPEKLLLTGNPVRKAIRELGKAMRDKGTFAEKKDFQVLVAGGSQGARGINMAVADALPLLRDMKNLYIVHQTGIHDYETVQAAYDNCGISGLVRPFFTDMAERYAAADLLVCRSGATTVAEITAVGKPAIFIPFPFAADNHQELNAQTLVNAGAAEMILQQDLTGEVLARRIADYMSRPGLLAEMTQNSRQLGRPDAADAIVADCYARLAQPDTGETDA